MKIPVNFELEFKKNLYPGLYIALEGIDGSGKTTQAEELAKYFRSKGKEVVVTQEPRREGLVGNLVHQILQGELEVPKTSLQYLFSADRTIHQESLILPALKAGRIVISDRTFWSGVAYGILDRDEDPPQRSSVDQLLVALSILSMYHQFVAPDFNIYLKVDTDTASERLSQKDKKREMYEKKDLPARVEKIYEWLANEFPTAFLTVHGERHLDEVTKEIIKTVETANKV